MMGVKSFSVFILLFQNVICSARVDPLVDSSVGLIRGLRATDGDYSMFLGIPYAKVNEDNPFGDSTPYPPFSETFDAFDDTPLCLQADNSNTVSGTLDCLQLNIYVPTSATFQNPLPVMVYIHGGGFSAGSATRAQLSPKFLVKHDVILVTLSYRVGVYGFMCLDVPEVPGNQGLKDQYLALQWIKNNIQSFGGNADKITLFGQSAGAHSIDLHLISANEKLYNQVILQSGAAVATTVLYEPDKSAALNIARRLGFETSDTNEALLFISKVDTYLVVAAAAELNIIFKPCVETQFDDKEPFLTSHWINGDEPKVKNMPVMLGFAEHEMAPFHMYRSAEYYESLTLVSDYLNRTFNFDSEKFIEMKNLMTHYYFADEEMSEQVKWGIIRFDTDYTYVHPIQRTIKKYLTNGVGNIYQYMFSYVGGRNNIITDVDLEPLKTICCASHSDELSYLFDSETKVELTATDEVVMEQITTMWTNFAKYSDPTPEATHLLPIKWLPVTNEKYHYMHIDTVLSLRSRPHNKRMAFLNLFYRHNEKSQTWYEEQ